MGNGLMGGVIRQRAATIFDDQNTWNLGRKKINVNRREALTNQTGMNRQIKQL